MKKPIFYLLVGLPGSGKSKIAEEYREKGAHVFSSDALRKELFGNETDQKHNAEVFDELHKRIKASLRNGQDTVYDACNIDKRRRAAFLNELKNIECEKVCLCVMTPYEICLERNKARERTIPERVIKRMYLNWCPPDVAEGFNSVDLLFPFEIEKSFEKYELRRLFRKDAEFMKFDQRNSHHTLTVGEHCNAAAKFVSDLMNDNYELLKKKPKEVMDNLFLVTDAAWLHDIGKPFTASYFNGRGERTDELHYYQHHCVGAYDSIFYLRNECPSCCLDDDAHKKNWLAISNLIYWHMRPFTGWKQSYKAMNRDRKLMSEQTFQNILLLYEADRSSH